MLDHVIVVAVIEDALASALVRCDNVRTHEEDNVRNECADLVNMSDSARKIRAGFTYGGVCHE